jgi:hypothetical protein
MQRFGLVVHALREWLISIVWLRALFPLSLYLLFGGVGVLFLYELLLQVVSSYSAFRTVDVLFNKIPLYVIGYYGFFLGGWLTLISKNVKYLPFGLWAYAFVLLFPFEHIGLHGIVGAVLYALAGYGLYRFAATAYGREEAGKARF